MYKDIKKYIENEIKEIKLNGMYKDERVLASPQDANIVLENGNKVLNFCSNNYLGLANHPEIIKAAKDSYDLSGYGLSSVRFICGTQKEHKILESKISNFLETEDTILYSSCFDANTGLFETLLSAQDAIISDSLNHASIIDGVRLCKAKRFRYKNSDMADLEKKLIESQDCRFRMIATDGVFSMDGYIARVDQICDLAEKYDAIVMVDDSHSVGVLGDRGRGTAEYWGVMDRVDIVTGTLGKALGGASGGYTSGRKEVIELLRQRSRPYLFSNSLAPAIVNTSIKVFDILSKTTKYHDKLMENCRYFRKGISQIGLNVLYGEHPIIPVMLGDAIIAKRFSEELLTRGIYVIGFSYPVVPKGEARIRVQISATHNIEDLDYTLSMFKEVKELLEL
ncbi:MAG: glycine C-acetyltransferase [Spirochaetaceae bacterium]